MFLKNRLLFWEHLFNSQPFGDAIEIKTALTYRNYFRMTGQLFIIIIVKIFLTRYKGRFGFINIFREKMFGVQTDAGVAIMVFFCHFDAIFTRVLLSTD